MGIGNNSYTDKTKDESNNYYERNINESYYSTERKEYSFIRNYLQDNDRVLEIGCGDGKNVFTLSLNKNIQFTGIDISTKAIEEARVRFPKYEFLVSSSVQTQFEDASFDCVYLGFLLYLLDRRHLTTMVAEVDRLLKNKGTLVISDFDIRFPCAKNYLHDQDVNLYKYSYPEMFEGFPHYHLVEKRNHSIKSFNNNHNTWTQTSVLSKDIDSYSWNEDSASG